MPELPEVETTRRGIEPYLIGQTIRRLVVREPRLRWRVSPTLARKLPGKTIRALSRRGKYLLLDVGTGHLIIHLGMSGSLRVVARTACVGKFDHLDLLLANGNCLRLRDPRRFGAVMWGGQDVMRHKLLAGLGPEPLAAEFSGEYLFYKTRGRRRAIRDVLLDGHMVAGIGNIYANEALYAAGIRPARAAGRITRKQYTVLARAIRRTLTAAIAAGGTTLRDFRGADGTPGYFHMALKVYGRAGLPCPSCNRSLTAVQLGQRTAFYCRSCQR